MKSLISMSVLLAFVSGFGLNVSAEVVTKEVNIAVNDAFVPETVDQNTDAKVIVSGMYPNSCYRWSRAETKTTDVYKHEIRSFALVSVNTMCLMVLVPFSKEVSLGRLPAGEHTLRFVSGDDTYFERTLTVK